MAIHPNPDRHQELMKQDHGTVCLITDPEADVILRRQEKERLRKSKEIKDAWTI